MIRDVRAAVASNGPALWSGFAEDAVEIDLIDGRREYLLCRPAFADFQRGRREAVTGCTMSGRNRVLAPDLSASLDIADGVQVIAIGTPAALEMDDATWRLTLIHEAFHQYQAHSRSYARAVDQMRRKLGAQSDWMLTYPFPYAQPDTATAFEAMSLAARAFLTAISDRASRDAVARYVAARRRAAATMSSTDWQYYEFQVGQEGVARWTELTLGGRLRASDPAVAAAANDRRLGLATSLRAIDQQGLGVWKRSAIYVFGALEAEMLQRHRPGWRADYLRQPFAIGEQLATIR